MEIKNRLVLIEAMSHHSIARKAIERWMIDVQEAVWASFQEVKTMYGKRVDAPLIEGIRIVIFNIKGNDFRLITHINYSKQTVRVLFFLTHSEYSKGFWKDRL